MPENLLYSYNINFSKDSSSTNDEFVGTASFSFYFESPEIDIHIGDELNDWLPKEIVPNKFIRDNEFLRKPGSYIFHDSEFPSLVVTNVTVSDCVVGTFSGLPFRQWLINVEGNLKNKSFTEYPDPVVTQYNVKAEGIDNENITFSGSFQTTNFGDEPVFILNVGETFTFPGVQTPLYCSSFSFNDELNSFGSRTWVVTYECSSVLNPDDESSLPDTETSISYEINGSTVRSVSGEFIALRRSQNPVTKKSITVYTSTVDAVAVPGTIYEDGIVISENIIKETVKNNGVVTNSYYKHTIEVEA